MALPPAGRAAELVLVVSARKAAENTEKLKKSHAD